jgi:hypothetical protein
MGTKEHLHKTAEVASLAVCDRRTAGWSKAISHSGYDTLDYIPLFLRDWSSYCQDKRGSDALSCGLTAASSTTHRSQSFSCLKTIGRLCNNTAPAASNFGDVTFSVQPTSETLITLKY